MCKSDKPVIIS